MREPKTTRIKGVRTVISNSVTPKINKLIYIRAIEDLGGSAAGLQDFMNTKIAVAAEGKTGYIGRQTVSDFWTAKTNIANTWLVILEWYKSYLIHQIQR